MRRSPYGSQSNQPQSSEYAVWFYANGGDTSVNGEGSTRTVASVTGYNPDDLLYATMHLGDGTRWTEIGWYFWQNSGNIQYEIYAYNASNSSPWALISPTAPGGRIYVYYSYSGYSSPPWYLWNDYLWNGTQYQMVAQGWLSCAVACGPSDPNVATESWTNDNNDLMFLKLNGPADASNVQVSINGFWSPWTPSSIPNTTTVTTSGPPNHAPVYCMNFDNFYYNSYALMC